MAWSRGVYRLVQEALCAKGMRRHTKGIFTRLVTHDITGVVRLNSATKYIFQINPIIALQYQPLECLLAELERREFHPYRSGDTIASPIGYLSEPRAFRQWSFEEGADNAATVADMVHEITTVGFRYMEENATVEAMCDRIAKDRHFIMDSDVYQLPVGYLMLGRYNDAERVIREELATIAAYKKPTLEEHEAAQGEKLLPEVIALLEKTRNDPIEAHVNYRRFAQALFEKLDAARRGIDPVP